jgi:hypothetical protein
MGIETAQCKCISGGPSQRAGPFDIILCDCGRVLPSAHTQPVGVGRRWEAGVPWERATASPKYRRAPAHAGQLRRPCAACLANPCGARPPPGHPAFRGKATLRDCNGEWRLQLTALVIPMLGVESQARWRARSEFSE